jgi:hypothetical protein
MVARPPAARMNYEHVSVVLDDATVAAIEDRLDPGETLEDWVEAAVADAHGDGDTVGDPLER